METIGANTNFTPASSEENTPTETDVQKWGPELEKSATTGITFYKHGIEAVLHHGLTTGQDTPMAALKKTVSFLATPEASLLRPADKEEIFSHIAREVLTKGGALNDEIVKIEKDRVHNFSTSFPSPEDGRSIFSLAENITEQSKNLPGANLVRPIIEDAVTTEIAANLKNKAIFNSEGYDGNILNEELREAYYQALLKTSLDIFHFIKQQKSVLTDEAMAKMADEGFSKLRGEQEKKALESPTIARIPSQLRHTFIKHTLILVNGQKYTSEQFAQDPDLKTHIDENSKNIASTYIDKNDFIDANERLPQDYQKKLQQFSTNIQLSLSTVLTKGTLREKADMLTMLRPVLNSEDVAKADSSQLIEALKLYKEGKKEEFDSFIEHAAAIVIADEQTQGVFEAPTHPDSKQEMTEDEAMEYWMKKKAKLEAEDKQSKDHHIRISLQDHTFENEEVISALCDRFAKNNEAVQFIRQRTEELKAIEMNSKDKLDKLISDVLTQYKPDNGGEIDSKELTDGLLTSSQVISDNDVKNSLSIDYENLNSIKRAHEVSQFIDKVEEVASTGLIIDPKQKQDYVNRILEMIARMRVRSALHIEPQVDLNREDALNQLETGINVPDEVKAQYDIESKVFSNYLQELQKSKHIHQILTRAFKRVEQITISTGTKAEIVYDENFFVVFDKAVALFEQDEVLKDAPDKLLKVKRELLTYSAITALREHIHKPVSNSSDIVYIKDLKADSKDTLNQYIEYLNKFRLIYSLNSYEQWKSQKQAGTPTVG